MKSFKYTTPATAKEACGLLGEASLALAGGSNLLNLMKEHVLEPDVIVDVKKIADGDNAARAIRTTDRGLRIGANVTLAEILAHDGVRSGYPALRQAVAEIATPQIRNRATIAGNLCARPSCWYFTREGYDCAKNGGQGCAAKTGDNEFHAVFDTDGPCVSVHPSSAAPALLALGARVTIAGPESTRELALEEFFAPPTRDVTRENVLAANEIVVAIDVPKPVGPNATYQVRQKAAHDWPLALASVALEMNGEVCRSARIYLGAVAPAPRRARAAEEALTSGRITEETATRAAAAALADAKALQHNAYKIAIARAAVKRALLLAATGKAY